MSKTAKNKNTKYQKVPINSNILVTEDSYFRVYQISRVKYPFQPDNNFFRKYGAPLSSEHIETIFTGLQWDEIIWGN